MILGVDVSGVQGAVDWQKLAGAGVRFAWLKCTEGNTRGRDTTFARNVRDAKAAGVLVGAYHFCYPLPHGAEHPAGRDPVTQAQRAFAESDQLGRLEGELPPAVDIEWPPEWERDKKTGELVNLWNRWGVTAGSIATWTLAYLEEAERLWGRVPVLYTYPHFWASLGEAGRRPEFARYPLWIANYLHPAPGLPPDTKRPVVPAPWSSWLVWQYSADGGAHLPGVATDIDRDAFAGTEEELAALGAGATPSYVEELEGETDGGDARRDATSEAISEAARAEIAGRAGG